MRYVSSTAIFLALTISVLTASTVTSLNAPGDLDLTFSDDGKLIDWSGYANGVAIQPDGKIVIAGGVNKYDFGVARYNPDGSPDTTFDGDGKVTTSLGSVYGGARSVAIQPDGKIVAAGMSGNDGSRGHFTLIRYNSDGSLDTTFGGDGVVTTWLGTYWVAANAVAIQADGKILAAGMSDPLADFPLLTVVRYNPNGSLDKSFHGDGIGEMSYSTDFDEALSVAIQSDGKIVAAGYDYARYNENDWAVARYNADGTLDSTFGGDGTVIAPMGRGTHTAYSVAIRSDGKIVTAGRSGSGSNTDFALVSYNPNGSLDSTFGRGGIVTTSISTGNDFGASVVIQSDARIVVAGTSSSDFALLRYNPDGSLDRTFGGGDGITTVDFDNSVDSAYGMALDNRGRAVVVGGSNGMFAIARFLLAPRRAVADFDGDGRSDISVFRPTDSIWYLDQSSAGFAATHFGLPSDKITPADYDGDGKTDISVFRDGSWWRINSSDGTVVSMHFGVAGDIPVPADYTGYGRDELAVYRDGQWWTFDLSNNQTSVTNFGLASDKPVPADYDGDGRVDQAVYRNGEWHLNRSSLGYAVGHFGLRTDLPVVADYDGDGIADFAVYRDGTWYLQKSTEGFAAFQWGLSTDIPVPADYDGDGRIDAAIYRNGRWYVLKTTGGVSIQQFGLTNDKPIPSAYSP